MENSDNTVALAENKVLILYLLNQIPNGIIENGLYKIVTSINNVNYFFFKQVLTDLIDTKLVGQITKDEDETIIKITSEGKNALSLEPATVLTSNKVSLFSTILHFIV